MCFVELALFIWGLVILIMGKIKIGSFYSSGGFARLAGVALMMGFVIGTGYEIVIGFKLGMEAAQQGKQFDQSALQKSEILVPMLIFHGIGMGVAILGGITFALLGRGSPEDEGYSSRRRRRRDEDEEDDDDDRPRRRRDEDDDDEYAR